MTVSVNDSGDYRSEGWLILSEGEQLPIRTRWAGPEPSEDHLAAALKHLSALTADDAEDLP